MEKNIKFLKVLIDNENINFTLQNKTKEPIDFIFNNNNYHLDSILDINLKKKDFENFYNNYFTDFSIDINNIKGFGENSFVETKSGPIKIKDITVDDLILDSNGEEIVVKNIIIFKINDENEKIININKSKCGINLPYDELLMSIKNNIKIKKIILKGRNLFLNGKASLIDSKNILLYNIQTQDKKNYLINGFIVESI